MAVKIDGFAERRIFFASFEERGLERRRLEAGSTKWAGAVALADGFDDGARIDAFVDVEGDGGNFEGGVFFFAGPDELRVEVGIIGVGLAGCDGRIGLGSDEADGRIVDAGFGFVVVLLDGSF